MKPVSDHFTQQCPSVNHLRVTPIEQVQRFIPEAYTFRGMEYREDMLQFFQREKFWIDKLNTWAPYGLNIRKELPPPIPFILTFCDQTPDISRIVKSYYQKIQERTYPTHKAQLVSAYKRGKKLKDLLVTATLN